MEKDCVGLIRDFCMAVKKKKSNNENPWNYVCSMRDLAEKSPHWIVFFSFFFFFLVTRIDFCFYVMYTLLRVIVRVKFCDQEIWRFVEIGWHWSDNYLGMDVVSPRKRRMEERNSTFSRTTGRGDRSFDFCDHRLNASFDHEYLEFEEMSFLCDEVNNVFEDNYRSSCFDKNPYINICIKIEWTNRVFEICIVKKDKILDGILSYPDL